jgi:hypothetical protein
VCHYRTSPFSNKVSKDCPEYKEDGRSSNEVSTVRDRHKLGWAPEKKKGSVEVKQTG